MTTQKRPVIFGEVLFDTFPDGKAVLGGAPFNVAWHCQAFGLNPLLISRVGCDQYGEDILAAMRDWGMDVSAIQQDTQHPTGVVKVFFEEGQPGYEIVENSAWDFIDQRALPELSAANLIYHGSLVARNAVSAGALDSVLQQLSVPVFVDVNLRAPWWDENTISQIIASASWLKLNDEELELIVPGDDGQPEKMQALMQHNGLERLIVTLGAEGLRAIDVDGKDYRVMPEQQAKVVDTVGAGDSFSSVLLLGYYKGWPLQQTLQRAQQFASAVVGLRGATTNSMDFYQPFIDEWKLSV